MFMAALGTIRMAGTTGTQSTAASSTGFISRLAAAAWLRGRQELAYYRALRELGRLDDRDLDDLAIGRADFPELAWRHALAIA